MFSQAAQQDQKLIMSLCFLFTQVWTGQWRIPSLNTYCSPERQVILGIDPVASLYLMGSVHAFTDKCVLFLHTLMPAHCCHCVEKYSPWGEPASFSIMSYKLSPCREHGLSPLKSRWTNGWLMSLMQMSWYLQAYDSTGLLVHISSCAGATTVCSKPGCSSQTAKPCVGAEFASGPKHKGSSGTQDLVGLLS